MSTFGRALLEQLGPDDLAELAERLRPLLQAQAEHGTASWLDAAETAEYLRCPRSRVYALVSAKRIPHHKDGSRLLFNRDELDRWVRAGGGRRP